MSALAKRLARSIRHEPERWQETTWNNGQKAVLGNWLLSIVGLTRDDNVTVIETQAMFVHNISIRPNAGTGENDIACHWLDKWRLIAALGHWRSRRAKINKHLAAMRIQ